ncbi:MAG: hypothetical protein Q9157_001145 [Trypethelium eluteriae]
MASIAPPVTPMACEPDPLVGVRSASMTPPIPPLAIHGVDAFSLDPVQDSSTNAFDDTEDVFQDFGSTLPLDLLWSPTTDVTTTCSNLINSTGTAGPAHTAGSLPPYPQSYNKWQSLQTPASTAVPESFSTTSEFAQEPRTEHERPPPEPYHSGQDCMALALQVVYDLHVPREHCRTAASSDPMTCIQTFKDEPRDVDSVLFLNRDAIKSVNKILGCPCSADRSVALACYLAAAKIIEWYGAAIGISVDASRDDGHENGANGFLDDEVKLRPMSDRIISRPIFMGRYCLDAEVHRSVRAKVVLSELREHIQPLMSRLPRYHISQASGKGAKHGAPVASPFSKDNDNSSCMLRNQVRKIIREASNINKHL